MINVTKKKIVSVLMLLVCISSLLPSRNTFAATPINYANEISGTLEKQLLTTVNGTPVDADIDINTKLQSTYMSNSGDIKQIYAADATSTFEAIIDDGGELLVEPRANVSERTLTEASENYSDWLQLKTTIYYETGTYNTIGYIKLTKVSTTVSYIGANVKSNLLKLRYGYFGYNLDTELLMSGQYTSAWTSKSSALNLSTSASCPRLELTPGGIPYNVFGEASCSASRGNTSFTVSHSVREIDAPAPPYD